MPRIYRKQKPPLNIKRNSQFKSYLRIDFRYCCAYCHRSEGLLPISFFGVEHFRPKAKFKSLQYRYSNLLYACNDCNRVKGEKWPGRGERQAGCRFLNPCVDAFEEHFGVSAATGVATPRSNAGEYFLHHLQLNREDLVAWRQRKSILEGWVKDLIHLLGEMRVAEKPENERRLATLRAKLSFLVTELARYGDWWPATGQAAARS